MGSGRSSGILRLRLLVVPAAQRTILAQDDDILCVEVLEMFAEFGEAAYY
jgi:hypothetical protein